MTELRGNEAWHLALLQSWGQHEEARHYLEQLNRVQRAFGREPYSMPAAASVGLPDLVTCDAAVFDVLGEQVERELRFLMEQQGDAARAARAVAASQSRRVSPSRPSGLPSLSQGEM